LKGHNHELFTSQIVLDEIAEGERAMASRRLKIMSGVPVLELTTEAADLTQRILDAGLLPAKADADAAHIALATIHQMDILLTWNCRHIANVEIQARLRRLVEAAGQQLPITCTVDEIVGGLYEHND